MLTDPPPTPTPPPAPKAKRLETIIKLRFPIKVGGVETTELKMRRPKVRDRVAALSQNVSDVEKEVLLVGNLVGLTPDEMEDLDQIEYLSLQKAYQDFLEEK